MLMRMFKFKMGCIDTKRRERFKLLGDDNTRCQYKIGQNTMDYVSEKDSNISFNLKGLYARLCNANMYMQTMDGKVRVGLTMGEKRGALSAAVAILVCAPREIGIHTIDQISTQTPNSKRRLFLNSDQ
jgi:hypothetical protein